MLATVHVFNGKGERLGIWESDQVGSLRRQMPFSGRQTIQLSIPRHLATGTLCRFGNLVVVESDTGVELWGGVIRGRRSWRLEGPTVPIQSWEAFLQAATTPPTVTYQDMNAGRMIKELLGDTLRQFDFPIVIGDISDAGPVTERSFRLDSVYDVINRLHSDSDRSSRIQRRIAAIRGMLSRRTPQGITNEMQDDGFDWWIETTWDEWQSHPVGVFHLTPRAGRQTGLLLSEGLNVDSVQKTEDDERAVTEAVVMGSGGAGWTERPTVTETDASLLDELQWTRRNVSIRNDLDSADALRVAARGLLSGPEEHLTVSITNDGGEWAEIRGGDTVLTNLPSYEFADEGDGSAVRRKRVVGRMVDEHRGIQTLQLVAED